MYKVKYMNIQIYENLPLHKELRSDTRHSRGSRLQQKIFIPRARAASIFNYLASIFAGSGYEAERQFARLCVFAQAIRSSIDWQERFFPLGERRVPILFASRLLAGRLPAADI